jgi:DNA helicase-2/ATP-dependent DNA helicase PcrA
MTSAADPIDALMASPAPPRVGDAWTSFLQAVAVLRDSKAGWPAELELCRVWYEPHLERIHEDAATRRADLVQLEQIAGSYPSRGRFLTELTLDPPDATSDQAGVPLRDEDYLILSTIHSAKGQECRSSCSTWSMVVFLLISARGQLPRSRKNGDCCTLP